MQDNKNLSEIEIQDQKIIQNKELNLLEALIPVVLLMGMLAYNIFIADGELLGEYSNQYILLIKLNSMLYRCLGKLILNF